MNQRQRELIEMLLKQAGYKEEGKMWVNHNVECAFGIKELFPESTTTLPVDVKELEDKYIESVRVSSASIDPKRDRDRLLGFKAGYLAGAQQSGELFDMIRKALGELVYLKSIKGIPDYKEEYERRKPIAWTNAKAAMGAYSKSKGE